MPTNQQIVLDNRSLGEAVASNFRLVSSQMPGLQDGQVQVHFPCIGYALKPQVSS